jgi:RES domain-containing protein
LIVYRLTRRKCADDLGGTGGLYASGRCNHKGHSGYASQHVSLALAEVLVHMDMSDLPDDYVLVTIEIPETVPRRHATSEEALLASLRPPVPMFLVPSVVVPQELNIVMYPQAQGFGARIVKVEPFRFDERLLGGRGRP